MSVHLTPPGPHPSITQQKLIANSLVPSLCSDPVHSQAISSPHLSPETHATTSVVPDDLDTTVNTHIENSPTLLLEKPTMQVQLSVSPEIPMEELKADPSPASSLNLLTTPHPSSLRLEKAKARKPPDPPRSYGERGNSHTSRDHSQDGGRSAGVVDRERDRSHSPRRHHLVDRTNPHENRTRMEQNPRNSSPLRSDGIHEIHRPGSPKDT
ncbi:hypothetical protein LOK49_LG03G01008 [Camellia lanceoleosa]|uniref:Uncharacterized protein n=1 Tax=Camellia lanceoleosa TaxID=1840588 RepID=A0ACC0I8R0_9ERIC|nr:hypothetical protein LOK49_LG03G01008 [Camellia lanceoleosa]